MPSPTTARPLAKQLQTVTANVIPNKMRAEQHRKMAEPGTAQK